MKLASYKGIRSGYMKLGSYAIRLRLFGIYSHSEIVFEPEDGVGYLMPDESCDKTEEGLWSVSSVGLETIPLWSKRRPGKIGGVRFKRIDYSDSTKWDLIDVDFIDPNVAAHTARVYEGALYDWQLILGFLAWIIPNKKNRFMCSELCALVLQMEDAHRFDPCVLRATIKTIKDKYVNCTD